MSNHVTMTDVAKYVKVSQPTVSYVLTGRWKERGISLATYKRVVKAVQVLNYRPNIHARSLRMGKTSTVGVISYDTGDPLAIALGSSLDFHFSKQNYRTVVSDAKHSPEKAEKHVNEFMADRVDGLVLIAPSYRPLPSTLKKVVAAKLPVVSIGRDLSAVNIHSVMIDNMGGAKLATAHLLELGYRRIGFILGPAMYGVDGQQRWMGAQKVCRQFGLDIDPSLVVQEQDGGWNPAVGYHSMKKMLQQADAPQAVVTFDDCAAFGAIRALREADLHVPEDVAVVGFDDLMVSEFYNPPLTTVRQPVEVMARKASDYLYDCMQGRKAIRVDCDVVAGELIVRESCGAKQKR